jgi:hypothetical protein
VWEPSGLWEPAEASAFAEDLNIKTLYTAFVSGRPVRDPKTPERLIGEGIWLRAEGSARRARLSADQIDALLDHSDMDREWTMIFAGPKAISNLESFRSSEVLRR